jgi:histidinol phosphatase-like enzyme
MGRFSVETSLKNPHQNNIPGIPGGQPGFPSDWPSVFPKETIGIELPGIILEEGEILKPEEVRVIAPSLAAVRELRLKGYKVFLFFNEPLISSGKLTQIDVDSRIQHLMQVFGQYGIFSIDGILYSTSSLKDDIYAFPNNGMLKRAENEFGQKFKGGYFISNNINGLKAGFASNARPIFIESGNFEITQNKLDTFANRDLKSKVKVFKDLTSFASTLS